MAEPIEDLSIRKKFNNTTAGGLGIAKNGKLQYPFKFLDGENLSDAYNHYGQPRPKVGDYCALVIPSGLMTAGRIGKILEDHPEGIVHDGHYLVEYLDGKIEPAWRYATGLVTEEQLKEVVQSYADYDPKKNPINVDWVPE